MKHEDYIDKRIQHHKKMIDVLSNHKKNLKLGKNSRKNLEKTYMMIEGYEFVLKKKDKIR